MTSTQLQELTTTLKAHIDDVVRMEIGNLDARIRYGVRAAIQDFGPAEVREIVGKAIKHEIEVEVRLRSRAS